jgi:hypothetical protein
MIKKFIHFSNRLIWLGISMKSGRNSLVKAGLSIVLCSWLVYTVYWFFKVSGWVAQAYTYTFLIDFILEAAGTLGLIFRIGAVTAATLATVSFLKGKDVSRVVKLVGFAVVLEAFYFLCFIPSAVFGFQTGFGSSGGHTLISGQSGGLWFIIETGIPTLVESIIMPTSLFKLRSKLSPALRLQKGAVKWACVAGVSYLIVFWLTYFTQWIATIIQPESYAFSYPGYGMEYILDNPVNMVTFLLTSVGLLLLIVFFLWSTLPTMRNPAAGLNLRKVGVTLTLLGGYFITIITLFRIFGPVGGPSVWIEFFMYSNADLWCVVLPALGIPMILAKKLA